MKTIYDDKLIFRNLFKDAQVCYWNNKHPICKGSLNFWDDMYGHMINTPIYVNNNYIVEHFSLDDFYRQQLDVGIYRITCTDNSYCSYLISNNDNDYEGVVLSPFCETYLETNKNTKVLVSNDCFCYKLTGLEKLIYKIRVKFSLIKEISSTIYYKNCNTSSIDKIYRMGYYDGQIDAYSKDKIINDDK